MNKHNSLKLLAATIIGSSVALSGMPAQKTLKINVPAKDKSVDTGIKVEKGARINVIDARCYFVGSGPEVVNKFMDCGNLERGFARTRYQHHT